MWNTFYSTETASRCQKGKFKERILNISWNISNDCSSSLESLKGCMVIPKKKELIYKMSTAITYLGMLLANQKNTFFCLNVRK